MRRAPDRCEKMERKETEKFPFDENGRLPPAEWDRLLSLLDEEIRQAEEAAARRVGWSEERDELYFFEMEGFEEETDEETEEEGEPEEIPEWELDLDGF